MIITYPANKSILNKKTRETDLVAFPFSCFWGGTLEAAIVLAALSAGRK